MARPLPRLYARSSDSLRVPAGTRSGGLRGPFIFSAILREWSMTVTESPWHPENEVERLLCSLAGVVSAHVVANPMGRLDEIHILASPLFGPKQIVRNVESALSAGLGIVVDRRIISVAQIRRDALEPNRPILAEFQTTAEPEPPSAAEPTRRLVYVRYDAHSRTNAGTECRVTMRRESAEFIGEGNGAGTTPGRALAGARAAFAAIASAFERDEFGLESATTVEANGKPYVLVAARAVEGRETVPLTGVAPLDRSPEEAAILASLQATNRWTGWTE